MSGFSTSAGIGFFRYKNIDSDIEYETFIKRAMLKAVEIKLYNSRYSKTFRIGYRIGKRIFDSLAEIERWKRGGYDRPSWWESEMM